MLPLPGSPGATLALYKARLASLFHGADPNVCLAFWLFGVTNNVLYVIILSAALDLVGPSVPKGLVLLADIVPSFFIKLTAPYFIDAVPYATRIWLLAATSAAGMLLIALSPATTDAHSITLKLGGAALASLSSGLGELSFLGLTHHYGRFALAAWGSGTGGAGLLGAGAYVLATTVVGLGVRTSLAAFAGLPVVLVVALFGVLPGEPLRRAGVLARGYQRVEQAVEDEGSDGGEGMENSAYSENGGVLAASMQSVKSFESMAVGERTLGEKFRMNLRRTSRLFFPYMLPLLLVYIAEYTINQGVAPTLLFPLASTPFRTYRSFYPTYNALYQTGVFLARSSTPFLRIRGLYAPSLLQVANLALLTAHALFNILPNVYVVFAIIFWEGLLGGLVYVSTFAEIAENVPREDREFSLGATTVSDSAGICIAGFVGMALEVGLCEWQVARGRDYCRRE